MTLQVTLLGLLDLSAAFDCVDHFMLLERLQSAFGLTDFVHADLSDRQNAADYLQWSTVFRAVSTIWGSARIRTGPAVVSSVHT